MLSERGKLATGHEFKQLKQRNVSLLVKLVKLYLDHSRLWKSRESLKIVNMMMWTLSQAAVGANHISSTKTSTQRAWFHFPRAEK